MLIRTGFLLVRAFLSLTHPLSHYPLSVDQMRSYASGNSSYYRACLLFQRELLCGDVLFVAFCLHASGRLCDVTMNLVRFIFIFVRSRLPVTCVCACARPRFLLRKLQAVLNLVNHLCAQPDNPLTFPILNVPVKKENTLVAQGGQKNCFWTFFASQLTWSVKHQWRQLQRMQSYLTSPNIVKESICIHTRQSTRLNTMHYVPEVALLLDLIPMRACSSFIVQFCAPFKQQQNKGAPQPNRLQASLACMLLLARRSCSACFHWGWGVIFLFFVLFYLSQFWFRCLVMMCVCCAYVLRVGWVFFHFTLTTAKTLDLGLMVY